MRQGSNGVVVVHVREELFVIHGAAGWRRSESADPDFCSVRYGMRVIRKVTATTISPDL
jgi:hypothetical protein